MSDWREIGLALRFNWFTPIKSPRPLPLLTLSWHASPLRRSIQAAGLLLFLAMFFWVSHDQHMDWFVELFLALDPLVSVSAAIAARTWVWSLSFAAIILGVGLLLPRSFCGYICPLGALVDLFDWIAKPITGRAALPGRARHGPPVKPLGFWRNLRYFVLAAVLLSSAAGVMVAGFVSAIPVLTRGFQFIFNSGTGPGTTVPGLYGQSISIGLFVLVLLLGLIRPRFWCRHLCPSGALFSAVSHLRLTHRHVGRNCIRCGRCSTVCTFDAINDDFTTIGANCTFCQTCGGVCPVGAIDFSLRWGEGHVPSAPCQVPHENVGETGRRGEEETGRDGGERATDEVTPWLQPAAPPSSYPLDTQHSALGMSRRGFVIGTASGAVVGCLAATGIRLTTPAEAAPLVRPPGSVPEDRFLKLCIRCGQCLTVCPTNVLQPAGFQQGVDRMWTPRANTEWAGCDSTCHRCGQVCPTGAIRELNLEQKQATRMGLAEVDHKTCLVWQGGTDCVDGGNEQSLFCLNACPNEAIDFLIDTEAGRSGPVPNPDICVGCGLCRVTCYSANVRSGKLKAAAIRVQAGPGKEDRLTSSSPPIRLRNRHRQRMNGPAPL